MCSFSYSEEEQGSLFCGTHFGIEFVSEASNAKVKSNTRFQCWMHQILDWSNQTPWSGTGEWFRICLGMSITLVLSRYWTEAHKLLVKTAISAS